MGLYLKLFDLEDCEDRDPLVVREACNLDLSVRMRWL